MELYGVQRQLAQLHETLEKANDNLSTLGSISSEIEKQRTECNEQNAQRKSQLEEKRKKCTQFIISTNAFA